jgi:hypothetical protein
VEADLVERPGWIGDLEPPAEGLEEAPQHSEVVLPRGVGHPALVTQVHDVRLDLVCTYTLVGCVYCVLAAVAIGDPALEELELLTVVV